MLHTYNGKKGLLENRFSDFFFFRFLTALDVNKGLKQMAGPLRGGGVKPGPLRKKDFKTKKVPMAIKL